MRAINHQTQGYNRSDARIGKRVELPAFSDQWMRGARFGTVRAVIYDRTNNLDDILVVKVDHPQIKRLYRHFDYNFRVL